MSWPGGRRRSSKRALLGIVAEIEVDEAIHRKSRKPYKILFLTRLRWFCPLSLISLLAERNQGAAIIMTVLSEEEVVCVITSELRPCFVHSP